jgi:hypothetical protein
MNKERAPDETNEGLISLKTVDIVEMYRDPGHWVSVYLDSTNGVDDAHNGPATVLLDRLEQDGAVTSVLDRVREGVTGVPAAPETVAVFANDRGTLHRHRLTEPPRADVAHFGDLPYLVPLLEWRQTTLTHAVLDLVQPAELVIFHEDDSVDRLTPKTSDHASLAAHVGEALPASCELVVVYGPPTESEAIAALLRSRVGCLVLAYGDTSPTDNHGAEAYAADSDDLADKVVRQVATIAAAKTVGELEAFRRAAAEGRAVETVTDVVQALRAGSVTTLLLHDDPEDQRQGWFYGPPENVYLARPELEAAPEPFEGRLGDCLARSALLQGARVWVVPRTGPGGPAGEVGAVLSRPAADLDLLEATPMVSDSA